MSYNTNDDIKSLSGPIFIFGAGGFIGSNLLNQIFKIRKDVYGIVRQDTNRWRLNSMGIPTDNILECDIMIKESVKSIFNDYNPKTIFNLSAYGAYSNQKEYDLIYKTNILGTVNLIESSPEKSIFINSGSSSEYGTNSSFSNEGDQLDPNSHYSISKITTSYLTRYYANTEGRLILNLRFFSIYGYYEDPDRLIPKLTQNLRNNKLPKLVSKDISRDFVFIDDCIAAIISAALKLNMTISGNSYNICSGNMTKMEELVILAKELFNISATPKWGSMKNRAWDLKEWYGNPEKTLDDIGWSAKTKLQSGLKKYYKWQEKVSYSELMQAKSLTNKKISAIVACYKDGDAIPIMHERLTNTFKKININYEIIFVNDSSPDDSELIIDKICKKDPKVIGITHSRNFGSQAAFMSGIELSTGDSVVLLDGDLQDPPELIESFYEKWNQGFDVVYGIRVSREMSYHFNFIYRLFYTIFHRLSYIKIPKNAGDFSLIDRKVVNQLINLPETEQFLRGLRAWVGFKQTGVNYSRPKRMFGKSTNNFFKNIWWAKKAIFSFTFQPLGFMSYLGIVFTLIAFLGVVVQLILKIILPDTPTGFTTVIILILFFGGLNLLAISFIGEYISKIFEETKKRPKFIRKKIIKGDKEYKTAEEVKKFENVKSKKTLVEKL